jgi:hypothetical protein
MATRFSSDVSGKEVGPVVMDGLELGSGSDRMIAHGTLSC